MKYRYIIEDEDGEMTGTNNREDALKAAEIDMVLDVEEGIFLAHDGTIEMKLEAYKPPADEDDNESED